MFGKATMGLAVLVAAGCAFAGVAMAEGLEPQPEAANPHFIGKPHAPVGATMTPLGALNVGVPTDVQVTIRPEGRAQSVIVEFTAGEGLSVVSPVGSQQFAVTPGQPIRTVVQVVPQSGGSLRLTANVTLVDGAERQGRPISTALQVKGPVTIAARKPARTELDAKGQLVEPMQAETTVINKSNR